ncbi:unnamed protein product [Pleuronectes platessa]|uniref:Uncharacterized protein n=1 Tax=Pleuronectes platessa TaxID=8262 RepID=A0A9N7UWM3_PLEPL|nr:unnamed protein product [Pleuronectes platessa]
MKLGGRMQYGSGKNLMMQIRSSAHHPAAHIILRRTCYCGAHHPAAIPPAVHIVLRRTSAQIGALHPAAHILRRTSSCGSGGNYP